MDQPEKKRWKGNPPKNQTSHDQGSSRGGHRKPNSSTGGSQPQQGSSKPYNSNNNRGGGRPNFGNRGGFQGPHSFYKRNQAQEEETRLKVESHVVVRPVEKGCANYLRGKCYENLQETDPCHKVHLIRPKKLAKCRFWATQQCKMGDECVYSHDFPCKFFHLYNSCKVECQYSHEPLTDLKRKMLIKDLQLELLPSVIEHSFPSINGKTEKQAQNEAEADSDQQAPTFSLSGFYRDTLSSDDEQEKHSKVPGPDKLPESSGDSPDPEDSLTSGQATDVVEGKTDDLMSWDLSVVVSKKPRINYEVTRKTVPIGHTLFDPRLSALPIDRHSKTVKELGEVFDDVLESLKESDQSVESSQVK